jgi:TRAP-type C4-dicarboxylate transport system permease small subunit
MSPAFIKGLQRILGWDLQVLAFAFFVVVSWLGFAYFLKTHSPAVAAILNFIPEQKT